MSVFDYFHNKKVFVDIVVFAKQYWRSFLANVGLEQKINVVRNCLPRQFLLKKDLLYGGWWWCLHQYILKIIRWIDDTIELVNVLIHSTRMLHAPAASEHTKYENLIMFLDTQTHQQQWSTMYFPNDTFLDK